MTTELPKNAYITIGGYDVAWISPWSQFTTPGGIDWTIQSQYGWAPMTLNIYNQIGGLTAANFSFAGANVDYKTGNNLDEVSGANVQYLVNGLPQFDVAVATPWFTQWTWIDWGQGALGQWSLATGDIGGGCDGYCNESLAYRVHAEVPEPLSLALVGLGLAGIGFSRRKIKQ